MRRKHLKEEGGGGNSQVEKEYSITAPEGRVRARARPPNDRSGVPECGGFMRNGNSPGHYGRLADISAVVRVTI